MMLMIMSRRFGERARGRENKSYGTMVSMFGSVVQINYKILLDSQQLEILERVMDGMPCLSENKYVGVSIRYRSLRLYELLELPRVYPNIIIFVNIGTYLIQRLRDGKGKTRESRECWGILRGGVYLSIGIVKCLQWLADQAITRPSICKEGSVYWRKEMQLL